MELSKNAVAVLQKRYLERNEQGDPIETVEGLFERVAKAVAAADRHFDPKADLAAQQQEFYELMTSLRFLPNSPTLMNAGRPLGQLSACFVLPVGDSMEEIFEAVKQAAIDGAEATREMEAVKGRATYQTNKGVGHLDPGAVTMSYQIECLCDYIRDNLL